MHVLLTAGPTYEPLDPVRFLGNRSTGKMGYALAEAFAAAGARVTLVSGPSQLPDPTSPLIRTVRVETAAEMFAAAEPVAAEADIWCLRPPWPTTGPPKWQRKRLKNRAKP